MATWLTFVGVVSLFGNSLVLVGSVKYGAIKLDSVTTTLIRHVAVADIGTVLTFYPVAISFMSDKLYHGGKFCAARFYIGSTFQMFSLQLICALNASKLISVMRPLHSASWSKIRGHAIACMIWVITILLFIYLGISTKGRIIYQPQINTCLPDILQYNSVQMSVFKSFIFLSTCCPVLITLLSTCWLLSIAYKMSRSQPTEDSVKLQGVVTVVAIGALFSVSFAPWFCLLIINGSGLQNGTCTGVTLRVFVSFLFLNNICNFIIYAASIKSFKSFVSFKLLPSFIPCYFGDRTPEQPSVRQKIPKTWPLERRAIGRQCNFSLHTSSIALTE